MTSYAALLVVVWSALAPASSPRLVPMASARQCEALRQAMVRTPHVLGAHCVDLRPVAPIPGNYGGRDG